MTPESPQTIDERRRSKRFETPFEVEYRTLTQNPISGNVVAQNISRGGLACNEMQDLRDGFTVQLKMNVPGENLPVFATGTIAWTDGENAGVRLTKISKLDQERILEFIYQSWLKKQKQKR